MVAYDQNAVNDMQTTCSSVGYQPATVCVPVTVTPFANAKPTTTKCCGDPIIRPNCNTCRGCNRSCTFTLTQLICIKVPIELGANASVNTPSVLCGNATHENICENCKPDCADAGFACCQDK